MLINQIYSGRKAHLVLILIVLNKSYVQVSVCCLLEMFNTYFGFGADWLGFDLVIFAFGNS